MSTGVQFQIYYEKADVTGKTSIHRIKFVKKVSEDGQPYGPSHLFPPELQALVQHPEVKELKPIKSAIKILKDRTAYRNIKVTLQLNVWGALYSASPTRSISTSRSDIPHPKRTLHTITKDTVIEKYQGTCNNVNAWLAVFEKEFQRVGVEDIKFPEALRLFIDGLVVDWYSLRLKLLDLSDPWQVRKDLKIETFGDNGWSDMCMQ